MEFLTEYGLFLAKAVTIVVALGLIAGIIAAASGRGKKPEKGKLEILRLNEFVDEMHGAVQEAVLDKTAIKEVKKQRKKAEKDSKEKDKESRKRVFVLNFKGDIRATALSHLREEVTAILAEATKQDEVVVKLESGGGAVHSYGLAASQLDRIRKKEIPLTACVDKVAASGGYMMACVADKILSAPFAMIGSIGVIGQLPNFSRLLKKHDIDFEQHTAGEYKRTLTMLGENTDADREKFREDLTEIHDQFKQYVSERRQNLDVDKIATGEVWLGNRAKELGLVDEVLTSDEYLVEQMESADLFEVSYVQKKSLPEKLGMAADGSIDRVITRWIQRLNTGRFF